VTSSLSDCTWSEKEWKFRLSTTMRHPSLHFIYLSLDSSLFTSFLPFLFLSSFLFFSFFPFLSFPFLFHTHIYYFTSLSLLTPFPLFQSSLGLVRFHGIQSDRNNRCVKKIMIETQIYSGWRINLLIMIGRTRDTKSRIGSTPLD
jgi:hypothetical protein